MNAPDQFALPPHSIDAEHSLIGGLLIDPVAWDRVADLVSESDFYRDDHRKIFQHIAALSMAGKQVDVVTVFDAIERSNQAEQTGGLAYLGEIANATPSTANIRRYAEIVREKATLRRLIVAAETFRVSCFKPGGKSPSDLVDAVERQLTAEIDESADEPAALVDVLNDALKYIDSRADASGLRSGFADLDKLTGGFEPGQLIVIAARPSVGKTLFACNVADNVAKRGNAVLFFTLEMSRREIGMRILASRSSVSMHDMRAGLKADADWDRMAGALPDAANQRMWIDDKPAIGVAYIRARAKRMKRQRGLDVIVVDYIGLMKGQGDNRVQEIGSISRGLKALAKELEIPIIALAQLNRGVESRQDKRPIMSDLRDSGEVEQDADIIAMLHREALYSDGPEWENFTELILRKNRNGPLGDVALHYDGRRMTFSPWANSNPRHTAAEEKPAPNRWRGNSF